MKINILLLWGLVGSVYFTTAFSYVLKKSGVNLWKVWWETGCNNLKTERRFAEEIRKFPKLNVGYQVIKWGTLVVPVSYLVYVTLHLCGFV